MLKNPDHKTAVELLLSVIKPVETERVALGESGGRVLAFELTAEENIPAFDRSPYDGYAFRASDSAAASRETPITLRVLEEIPAGSVPTMTVTEGTAAKVLTGAPIPPGADAVTMYEKTEFTKETVTLFAPSMPGENIIRAGEDVRKGQILLRKGQMIDPGAAGTLAAQGVARPSVYRVPRVGILSTGSELVEADETPGQGMIRNSNRHTLETAIRYIGLEPVYLGKAGDSVDAIHRLIEAGLESCDAVISTGGVSAGDYDLTPDAMEKAGAELLIRGIRIKPGMACAYGIRGGKLICGLSGNPASSITNFYVVAVPALKKLAGHRDPLPEGIELNLVGGFDKKSKVTRFLRGRLELSDGTVRMRIAHDQGNVVLSSTIGCNVLAEVPAGSGRLGDGAVLKGFLI